MTFAYSRLDLGGPLWQIRAVESPAVDASPAVARGTVGSSWAFCRDILPEVSRTFALTIPVLPEPLSDSVCCAYLLCRIADTIEDRSDLEDERRHQLFDALQTLVERPSSSMAERFRVLWPAVAAPDELYERLMQNVAHVAAALATLPESHRQAIRACVDEMVDGMRDMIRKPPTSGLVHICDDLVSLERYCHYVAGTVGIMLTRLFAAALSQPGWNTAEMRAKGQRFGLGLQLTNILKDHTVDLGRGISFFPASWLESFEGQRKLRGQKKRQLIERTLCHLEQANTYTLAIPAAASGIRLFCLWALWMASATLREVASSTSAQPKITRSEVSEIVLFTRQHVADDDALRKRFAEYQSHAAAAVRLVATS